MSHAYHDGLPGYNADQLMHDGCPTCERRAAMPDRGISSLDRQNFARAWARAAQLGRSGLPGMSAAEMPLLRALWAVQLQLQRHGVPIGYLPGRYDWRPAGDDERARDL